MPINSLTTLSFNIILYGTTKHVSMWLLIMNEINDKSFLRRWKFSSLMYKNKVKKVKLNWEFEFEITMMHAIQIESIVKIVIKAPRGSEERKRDMREVRKGYCRYFFIIYAHMQFHFILYSFQIIILNLKRKISKEERKFTYAACIIGERKIDQKKIVRFSKNNFRVFSCLAIVLDVHR